MKILFATMQFARGYGQGTERYVALLCEGLAARGHDVVVAAGDPERRGPRLKLGALTQDTPRTLFVPTRGWNAVRGLPPAAWRPLLQRERPDVVHVVNPAHIGGGVAEAALELGLPLVITIVDFWWLCPKHTLQHFERGVCDANVTWPECLRCLAATDARPLVRGVAALPGLRSVALPVLYAGKAMLRGTPVDELRRWTRRQEYALDLLDRAAIVIFLSAGGRTLLAPRLKKARSTTILVGLDPRWRAGARPPIDSTPRRPQDVTLGFVGALAEHKGPHLLLAALHQLGWRETRVLVAGGGTDARYEHRLRELARGLNVTLLGRVPTGEMPALLAGLDLLVVPSTWPENLPQTVLEALATRTPVIASDVAGISEVIGDPRLLFEVGSVAALAACLRDWCAAPRAAESPIPLPTRDEMVEATLDVYERARAVGAAGRADRPESRPEPRVHAT